MDEVSAEVEALINQFPQLRDNVYYVGCIQFQMKSCHARKDAVQFVKALAMFNQINLTAIMEDNGNIAFYYIANAYYCFDLSLLDEGFQQTSKINSTDLTTQQLTFVKSRIKLEMFKSVLVIGYGSNQLQQLKMLGKFY